jgi:formylglycine-generating enzyme required for sulfatase activity
LKQDRVNTQKTISWKGGVSDKVPWTLTSYIQPQVHPYDRYLYDPVKKVYTVDRYLEDLRTRYGGIDSVLVWPVYTQIGVDDKNQFDMWRTMPGGLDGVANMTAQFHKAGVKMLWPNKPWDQGTRVEPEGVPGQPDTDSKVYAKLLKQTGGDGLNGDTMGFFPQEFFDESAKLGHPISLEPEGGGSDQSLNWETMGWGYWNYPAFPAGPTVDRFKFVTEGKFLTNVCDRWAKDDAPNYRKTQNLQAAWFNGDGYESWENVWGVWNGIVPYDGEAIRRVGTMLRHFGKEGFLQSPDWEPYTREVWEQGIYASKFPLSERNQTVWTIVNRNNANLTVGLVVQEGKKYYDCYHGMELKAGPAPPSPGPTPTPPLPEGYNRFDGQNAYNGHGAVDIDDKPTSNMTNMECTSKCDATPDCSCVVFQPDGGNCWRRAKCTPQAFQAQATFTVYLKAQGYSTYTNANCYSGHGGLEIDDDQSAPVGLTVSECQDHCSADKDCECVTQQISNGKCWKRKACNPAGFAGDKFNVYVNEARCAPPKPTSPGTPLPGPQVHFPIEALGYGCFFESNTKADGAFADLLGTMSKLTAQPLASYDRTWKYLLQQLVDIPHTTLATKAPAGTVHVPREENYTFVVGGVEIEGDDAHGVDAQYPWEEHPQRNHQHTLAVGPFYMDKYPVTVANYSAYLGATKYKPADDYYWLKNWNGSTTAPAEIADLPVTYVSMEEARAYCAWKGARLPHSWEWQYAAQGTDGRLYPWGNDKDQSKFPVETSGNTFFGSEPVTAHAPQGDSVFGVSDLVGNVWQYTDELQDEHSRYVIVRGGSNYRPLGSGWYFPQAKELNKHNKYFLFDDRYERVGTVGFRCVVDAASEAIIV